MLVTDFNKLLAAQGIDAFGELELQETIGRPIHGDAVYDPDGLYSSSTGLDLSSKDFKPNAIIKGFTMAVAGTIGVTWVNGSTETIDLTAQSVGDINQYFLGFWTSINKTGTTATGIKPLF